MCGRVAVDYDEIIAGAQNTALTDWVTGPPQGASSSFNVAPTQHIPVAFVDHADGSPRYETAFWSLLPPWSKELKPKFPTFNARAESAHEKPTFKIPLESMRCAVTVSSFYEWTGPKSARTPHAIFGPEPLLPLAGLFSWWHGRATPGAPESWHLTCTILTQESAGIMTALHDRMPVFLDDALTRSWLDPQLPGTAVLGDVLAASRDYSATLSEHAVAPLRGDGPALLAPTNPPTLDV